MRDGSPIHPDAQTPMLVGRDRERAVLSRLFATTQGGRGCPVLISGEAGIGKTALANALWHEAEASGARVLIGRCYDRTETPPYGLLADLFARYDGVDDLPAFPLAFAERGRLGVVTSQAMVFNQVLDFVRLAVAERPLVLLLDDIHWSDPTSLDLLRVLARTCATQPLLLVVTYRANEVVGDHPLAPIMPLLVREANAVRLDLRPLDDQAVQTYVMGRYHLPPEETVAFARYLHGRSDGNPFFMTELLYTLEEDGILHQHEGDWVLGVLPYAGVPLLLRQVIEARLTRLGAEAQRLLTIAAVIGQEVSLALWQQVSGVAEETLLDLVERAVAAYIVEERGDGAAVTFVHALIREALYEGMLASRRRVLHRTIADLLIATDSSDPDAVASHLGAAGDARTVEWLIRAGERADAAYAYRTADARFTAALATLNAGDGDRGLRYELLLVLSRLSRQRDPAQSVHFLEEAVRLARETGDLALVGEALYRLGLRRAYDGDRRRGIAQAEEGFRILDALPSDSAVPRPARIKNSSVSQLQGRGNLANRIAEVGRYAEAARYAEQVIATDEDGMTMATMNGWEALVVVARMMGRAAEARQRSAALWTFNRTRGEHDTAQWFIGAELLWGVLAFWTDDRAYLWHLKTELETRPPEAGEVYAELPHGTMHLPHFFIAGEWAKARSVGEQARQTRFVGHPFTQGVSLVLGRIFVAQGDASAAWSLVRAELAEGAATEPGDHRFATSVALQGVAVMLALDADDLPLARQWLDAYDRWLAWSGAVLGRAESHLLWARYHRANGDPATAEAEAGRALTNATEPRQPLVLLAAHRLLGELATERQSYDDAARHLTAAQTLAAACHAPYEQALTMLAQAERYRAVGDIAAATALLDEAEVILVPLAAQPALARVERLRLHLTSAQPRQIAQLPDGLTGREAEVLRLLTTGLSNRELADVLGINARTVERHISNVYAKIGASSRAQATAYAARHNLL